MTFSDPYDLAPEVAALLDDESWDGLAEPLAFPERVFTVEHFERTHLCEQLIRANRNLETRKAGLIAELDRLKAKLAAVERRRDEIRDFLQSQMRLLGRRSLKTPIATASIVAGRDKIVLDEANIAEHVKCWPQSVVDKAVEYPPPKVNKQTLQREFGSSLLKELSGVSVETGEPYLTIR